MGNKDKAVTNIKLRSGLPALYVQVIAFLFLVAMFIVDKVFHFIIPPLGDPWYIGVASIAFFGADISQKLLNKIK